MADDLLSGISDESLANVERYRDAVEEIQKNFNSANRALKRQGDEAVAVGKAFSKIKEGADLVREIQDSITDSALNTEKAVKGANKQRSIARQLSVKIDDLLEKAKNATGDAAKNLRLQAYNLSEARDQALGMAGVLDKVAESSAGLDKSASFFNSISLVAERIPGLKAFSKPFQDASKAAKETALANAKTGKAMSTLGAGTKAFGKSLASAAKKFLPLLLIDTVVKAFKFVAELFVAADQNATQIGKNLGISKANAEGIRKEFIQIAKSSSNILSTSKSLLEAQVDLVKFSGAVTLQSFKQADAQVLLTKNLGIAGENAAMFQSLLSASGDDLGNVIEKTRVLSDEQFKTNGYFISNQQILQDIANTSAEIAGYYGFSADNLSRAAFQTRKFGLSLQNAKNISEGLLNFEQSISSELELELLTGKQFNLERARSLALTGDIAGATEQVMKEMSKMTEAQRRSPILMKSFSQLTGLSADELNRAYLVQTTLNRSTKDYIKLLEKEGRLEEAKLAEKLGLQGLTQDQIEKNISSQEKFNAAIEKAKDQFTGLVDSQIIDKLTNLLVDFVNKASRVGIFRAMISGPGAMVKTGNEAAQMLGSSEDFSNRLAKDRAATVKDLKSVIDKRRRLGDIDQSTISMLATKYSDSAVKEALTSLVEQYSGSQNDIDKAAARIYGRYTVNGEQITSKPQAGIQPTEGILRKKYVEDKKADLEARARKAETEETNALLKNLISAVKDGKTINLDGRKVNQGLVMASSKLDRF